MVIPRRKLNRGLVWFSVLFGVSLVIAPLGAKAAVLYLEPSTGQYQPGDTFIVEVRIDTQKQCINAVEGNLNFSQNILQAVDFSRGNSILTVWVEKPQINQKKGLISFKGGIPNGYCGRVLGDPKISNLLGKIVFKIPEMITRELEKNQARISFLNSSQVLLNDGLGTKAKLSFRNASFDISTEKLEVFPKDEWQEIIKEDNIPPESFNIEIGRNPKIFENKYFITFSTTDKQTGIDHYEVKEGKRSWIVTSSPYVLKNQKLTDNISVKAVDKAGNERIEMIKAPKRAVWKYVLDGILVLVLILVIIGLGIILKRIIAKPKRNYEH